MAASNLPKNDFSPAWLRLDQDNHKPAGSKSNSTERSNQRRGDGYYQRDFSRPHRQNSFDFFEGKRYPPQGQNKFRHGSLDNDYYGLPPPPPPHFPFYEPHYNNGYYDKISMPYSSQQSLLRSNSRDSGRHYSTKGAKRASHDRDRDGRKDSGGDARGKDRDGERDRPYNDDFPSLNGSAEPADVKKTPKSTSGVWDNPPKSNRNEDSSDLLKNSSPNIYKALVPNKSGSARKIGKEGVRLNGSMRDSSPLSSKPLPSQSAKDGTRQSPTPEILSAPLVMQPKKLGDKRDFLKALRNESSAKNVENGVGEQNHSSNGEKQLNGDSEMQPQQVPVNGEYVNENGLVNGVDHMTLSSITEHGKCISFSAQDEDRLLKLMGWNEDDDTDYSLTTEEIEKWKKEHEMASKQRNGLKRTLPATWSPHHRPQSVSSCGSSDEGGAIFS